MNRSALAFFICSFIAYGQDAVRTSTLTLGAGGLPYSDGAFSSQRGGPSFTGNYEYRLFRYLAAEAGTGVLLPSRLSLGQVSVIPSGQNFIVNTQGSSCTGAVIPPGQGTTGYTLGSACILVPSGRSQVTLVTYGFKGILPLAADRAELFLCLGGAYGWNSVAGRFDSAYAHGSAGARFALDRSHRFWVGTTLRGFTNFRRPQQAWLPWTFDLGFRFGH
jgi:hypothetical protein